MKFNDHLTIAQSLLRKNASTNLGNDQCLVVDVVAGSVAAVKISSLSPSARQLVEKFPYNITPPEGCIFCVSKDESRTLVLSVVPGRGIHAVREAVTA